MLHAASLHLAANVTNLFILETVRRHYGGDYSGLVTRTYGDLRDGWMPLPEGPGLGVELSGEVLKSPDVVIQRV